ncbi:MAG TPA: hypothetical protein VNA28_05490 [Solirubrobacteraceae bacterium]|nr:hypothetical protein [Solirubrobacteraceae bacterium]
MLLCALAMLAAAGSAAPAFAQEPATAFAADSTQIGVISLLFFGAQGGEVQYYERVSDRLKALGRARAAPGAVTTLKDATTWSCDRLERRFEARAVLPDGSTATGAYGVRTASCAQRFRVEAPRRVAAGKLARVRVIDRWNIGGIKPMLCITPPAGRRECRTLAFARAVAVATRRFRAEQRGRWRVELRVRDHRVRRDVAVGGDTTVRQVVLPSVLATGDSTMQGIDSYLSDELADDAALRSDIQLGSAISRGDFWATYAATQTKRLHQRVSVMSIGAAFDGYPLTPPGGAPVECCEEPWVALYAERVRAIMGTYLRRGRGRVFWLTPPLPRDPVRLKITTAITLAIERAATGLLGVRVVRVDQLFAPAGVYTEVIRYRGRDVRVRDPDGVHLNISGTAIMAQLLAPQIRAALAQTKPAG